MDEIMQKLEVKDETLHKRALQNDGGHDVLHVLHEDHEVVEGLRHLFNHFEHDSHEAELAPVKVSLDDIDDLIADLSPEEIAELAIVDPDDSSMPPSMRCDYNCDKSATGNLDRSAMLNTLEEEALKTPDKEERVEFVPGIIRGKKYVPKEDPNAVHVSSNDLNDDLSHAVELEPEEQKIYDDFFANATLEDVKEIADILGLTYQDHCEATPLRKYPDPEPNCCDIEDIIARVDKNDPDLIDVNVNNIKGITPKQWTRLFEALTKNTNVESLSAANCDITDTIAKIICTMLAKNKSLKSLTLDSNLITGDLVVELIESTAKMKKLEELRVTNQLNCRYLGNRIETAIVHALMGTPQLIKLGLTMEFRDTLNRAAVQLQKNLDRRRQSEDRVLTLRLDTKKGPKLVEE